MTARKDNGEAEQASAVTLKAVARHVGLTPGTVSAVLNNSPACRSVPERTKTRIFDAARELNYKPNYLARALRVKRTYTIGVIAAEIGDPYSSVVISGIERYLRAKDFFFLTVVHRHDASLLESYSRLLLERGVEGFITVDTSITQPPSLPTVAVAGHRSVPGVMNIVLDHHTAALMALKHLTELGHKEIAFMKGPASSSDSEDRWKAIVQVCRRLNIPIRPELTLRLEGDTASQDLGYPYAKRLLSRNVPFTALFGYNDNSAIGAIRAIHEAGLRVPEDISVVGFDDIQGAAYCNPSLTTVRQPLEKMGEIAARSLLDQIENREPFIPEVAIEPEFVVRKSTARPRPTVLQTFKAGARLASR